MDPRVKTAAAGLQKKFQAEMSLASMATRLSEAVIQGGSIRTQLEMLSSQPNSPAKEAVAEFQKKLTALLGVPGGFFSPPSPEPTLTRVSGEASTLYQQIWQSDAEPTSAQMEALGAADRSSSDLLKRWNEFKGADLPALNRQLRESQVPEVELQKDIDHDETELDEE